MASAVDAEATGRVAALSGMGRPAPGSEQASVAGTTGGVTNLGLSATTAPSTGSKTPLVVGLAAGVLVLGAGIVFAARMMSGPVEPAAASSTIATEAAEVMAPKPPEADQPKVELAEVAPPAAGSEPAPSEDDEAKPLKKSAVATRPALKPASRPKAAVATPVPKAEEAKVEPAPAPPPPPQPAPKARRSTPKKAASKPGVDLGY
jgi:hypothetical protein